MSVRGLGGKSMHSASAALGAGSKLHWPYACATACSKRRCRDTRCRRVAYHLAWFLRPGARLCANPCMKPGNAGRSRHKAAPCTRRVDLPLPAGALGSLWCCPADTAAVFVLGVGVCCYRPLPARGKPTFADLQAARVLLAMHLLARDTESWVQPAVSGVG